MMSVNELFYGNQQAPGWIVGTAAAQMKHYSSPGYYGSYPAYAIDTSFSRYDPYALQSYSYNYYTPSVDSYGSRYHDTQRSASSNYPASNYLSNSRQHENSSGSWSFNYDRPHTAAASSNYPSSNHHSTSRQFDNSSGSWSSNHDRPQAHNTDYFSSNNSYYPNRGNGRGPLNLVELRVPLCCEACEERVSGHLLALRGVESVKCDQFNEKVVVRGNCPPADILRVCRKLFKRSDFWRSSY